MKKLKLIMVVLEINHLPQNYNKCNVCRRCYINFFKPDMRINDRLYKMRLELNLEKFHFANVPWLMEHDYSIMFVLQKN